MISIMYRHYNPKDRTVGIGIDLYTHVGSGRIKAVRQINGVNSVHKALNTMSLVKIQSTVAGVT